MALEDVINSLNNNKRLFIQYGVPNVTEAFPFDVSIAELDNFQCEESPTY